MSSYAIVGLIYFEYEMSPKYFTSVMHHNIVRGFFFSISGQSSNSSNVVILGL